MTHCAGTAPNPAAQSGAPSAPGAPIRGALPRRTSDGALPREARHGGRRTSSGEQLASRRRRDDNDAADRAPDLGRRLALRPAEAADALGISERTLRSLLPRLPHVRLEGVVLLPIRELEQWLRDQVNARKHERREGVDAIVRGAFPS